MKAHPNRIINVALMNEFVSLCIANQKAARIHGDAQEQEACMKRFVRIIQFMTQYHFYLAGDDCAGNRFHFAYWGR